MAQRALPRVAIAGLSGDSGKTLLSLGLIFTMRSRGLRVAPFKKGPDFIDAAWAGAAAGSPGRNLDTYLMGEDAVLTSLSMSALDHDIAVIEGNRGLFDGMDVEGTHSTARLARLIGAPVVLVVEVEKMTRTVAAQVKGCQALEPDLNIAGVVLNRVGTARQETLIRQAIEKETSLPVIGAIPRLRDRLPSRHLGLLTAVEHPGAQEALKNVAEAIERYVDVSAVIALAARAPAVQDLRCITPRPVVEGGRVKIGVLQDRAFSFYYPENLSALEDSGAHLVPISPLVDRELPDIDGLYAGGGFPEVYAEQLSANEPLRIELNKAMERGLPVWAECGGLMYLSKNLTVDGVAYPMVGALPFSVEHTERPQGHGYVRAVVDADNPFFPEGEELRGHEFHYSRICDCEPGWQRSTVFGLKRGTGLGDKRDGIRVGNAVATYTHIHALGAPGWSAALVRAANGGRSRCAFTNEGKTVAHQYDAIGYW